jgi:ATP citrate (pro-S)-lyase
LACILLYCREGDQVYFYHEGGIDIGDVDAKAEKYKVEVDAPFTQEIIKVILFYFIF